jgi:hypothetical protein
MIFLQVEKVGHYLVCISVARHQVVSVCSRGAGANTLFSRIREEARLSPMVLTGYKHWVERRLRTQNRLCHLRQDICTLALFRSIRVPETDHVDSHRTPGYLYDKPKPLRLIAKGDNGLRVLRGRP